MRRIFNWDKKYLYWGVTAFCVIACSILFYMALAYLPTIGTALKALGRILSPFIWGLIICYLLSPMMNFMENRLFLPLGKLPSSPSSIHAIRIYQHISDVGFGAAVGNGAVGLSLVCLLVSASLILACLICLPMSLGKHGKARNLILNLLFLGSAAASAVLFVIGGGTLLLGAFVYLALIAAILCYNLYLAKKGLPIKHTVCLIGGLPSEEYFKMKEDGVPELEIRKKMVEALTVMQEEARAKEAREEAEALAKRAAHQ